MGLITMVTTKVIEINHKLKLSGHLTVKDQDGNVLVDTHNQITKAGVRQLIAGNGCKKITYLALGRGTSAESQEDVKLEKEYSRYLISNIQITNGIAIITVDITDNLTTKIDEFGLFMNNGNFDASAADSGILFSRVVASLQRLYKQMLLIEWRISLT